MVEAREIVDVAEREKKTVRLELPAEPPSSEDGTTAGDGSAGGRGRF